MDRRRTAPPAKRLDQQLQISGKGGMELRMTSSAGAVEVVMKPSSVPVAALAATRFRKAWFHHEEESIDTVPTRRKGKYSTLVESQDDGRGIENKKPPIP